LALVSFLTARTTTTKKHKKRKQKLVEFSAQKKTLLSQKAPRRKCNSPDILFVKPQKFAKFSSKFFYQAKRQSMKILRTQKKCA